MHRRLNGDDVDLQSHRQRQNRQNSSGLAGKNYSIKFAVVPIGYVVELVSVVVVAVDGELDGGASTKFRRCSRVSEDRQRYCMIEAVAIARGVDGVVLFRPSLLRQQFVGIVVNSILPRVDDDITGKSDRCVVMIFSLVATAATASRP